MRDLDTNVDDEKISEVLYEAVNFLILDEDKETPIDTYHKK